MADQVKFGFRTTLARNPRPQELTLLEDAYQQYRESYQDDLAGAEKLIQFGESKANATLDPRDLAAATAFSNVLLNLDETITKE